MENPLSKLGAILDDLRTRNLYNFLVSWKRAHLKGITNNIFFYSGATRCWTCKGCEEKNKTRKICPEIPELQRLGMKLSGSCKLFYHLTPSSLKVAKFLQKCALIVILRGWVSVVKYLYQAIPQCIQSLILVVEQLSSQLVKFFLLCQRQHVLSTDVQGKKNKAKTKNKCFGVWLMFCGCQASGIPNACTNETPTGHKHALRRDKHLWKLNCDMQMHGATF